MNDKVVEHEREKDRFECKRSPGSKEANTNLKQRSLQSFTSNANRETRDWNDGGEGPTEACLQKDMAK